MKKLSRYGSFMLLACVLLLAGCAGSSPQGTVTAFYQAVAAGNTDDALERVSFADAAGMENMVKSKLTLGLNQAKSRMDKHGGLASVEIVKVEHKDDNHAKVEAVLHFKDGTTDRTADKLVLVQGKWLVSP